MNHGHEPGPRGAALGTDTSRLQPIGVFGRYELLGRLAIGGMAEILLARPQGSSSRPVVLKKILAHFAADDDFKAMFEDEAKLGLLLSHPNIARFTDHGEVDGLGYIEMEWVDGIPLGRLIRRARDRGGLPPRLACWILERVADALDHAHRLTDEHGTPLRLVHRDVSPHNVMISFAGEVKLLDFGIAKAEERQHRTQTGVVKGKFAYMAPEQILAQKVDHRADLFALGVVLFEALIGKSLYRRESDAETMREIADGPVPSLADPRISDPDGVRARFLAAPETLALDRLLRHALAKRPDDRIPSAAAFRDALSGWLARTGGPVGEHDLATFVADCFEVELTRGPHLDTTPFGQSVVIGMHASIPEPRMDSGARELELDGPLDGLGLDLAGPLDLDPADARPTLRPPGAAPIATPRVEGGAAGPTRPHRAITEAAARPRAARPLAASPRVATSRPVEPQPSGGRTVALSVAAVLLLGGVGGAVYVWKPWARADAPAPTEAVSAPRPVPGRDEGPALFIVSLPPGATVFVDGEERGVTPLELTGLEPGERQLRVEAEGHLAHEETLTLAGADQTITARLRAAPSALDLSQADGLLTLDTTPRSEVFVSGHSFGPTPIRRQRVPSGALELELVGPDGERRRTRISVRGGRQETRVSLNLEDLR
ncbi:MAG: protein kinase [Myxococcales bacterium]|nr:protein kinase [Myxococcales bacterium]